ncbi:hypothetical protein [Pseudomonas sp. Irchel s3h14]|uniref:hypothetical protein n=1 Tax=Pseudomonas sp. Irchel s3h14 TaxID=2009179 RepID=UPI0021156761|nr:hypothetical protein [Pseudomonas sp. Irchel s3h14]
MMRPDAKVEKVYLYPKPVDFRKSIDGMAALVGIRSMNYTYRQTTASFTVASLA